MKDWEKGLADSREKYEELRAKHWVNPQSAADDDPTVNNPLSQVEGVSMIEEGRGREH